MGDANETIRKGKRTLVVYSKSAAIKIGDAHVKVFQGKKYLLMPEKGTIQHISDDVTEMESDEKLAAVVFLKAVLSCNEYQRRVNCSSKIKEVVDCVNCFAKMKVSSCNTVSPE